VRCVSFLRMNSFKDSKANVRLKSRGGALSAPLSHGDLNYRSSSQDLGTNAPTPASRTNKKPTKSVGIFELIEAQLKAPKKKVISSIPLSHPPSHHDKKPSSSLIEKVKVMKMSDQPMNEFVVVRKAHKKKLSTVKKRILLVTCSLSLRD
jgi:hypothetical protein